MTPAEPRPVASRSGLSGSGVGRFVVAVLRQTLAQPVAEGRLRDVGWPYGLRACVAAGYLAFAVAALLVLVSGPIRAAGVLLVDGTGLGLPAGMVWPLAVLLSFGAALLLVGALHGPWWVKLLGLLFALIIVATWSLRLSAAGGSGPRLAVAVPLIATLLVLGVVRGRRRFAWWELPAFWLLIAGPMLIGLGASAQSRGYGVDFNPLLLQQTAATLGFLALPAATVAGAAVAEVSVRAAVAATRGAQRLIRRGWAYPLLGVLLALRLAQAGRQLAHRDPVTEGPDELAWATGVVALLAAVGCLVLWLGRRAGARPDAAELPDELGGIGFAVAAVLFAVTIPVQVALAAVQVGTALSPGGSSSELTGGLTPLLTQLVDPLRALVGVVLIGLAVRAARRGRVSRALVTGCLGAMLVVLARQLVFGDLAALPIDPDLLNLVVFALVVVAVAVAAQRRRLDARRALAYAGLVLLSELVAYRDFVSDPVGALLGFSGAALVLFGLTWDLLTGSGWGNGDSRRFPRPARVLLVLTNAVLTMTVLAYAALVRDGSTTIYLDPYAQFGDLVLGTALLAAAVVAVFDAAARDTPVGRAGPG